MSDSSKPLFGRQVVLPWAPAHQIFGDQDRAGQEGQPLDTLHRGPGTRPVLPGQPAFHEGGAHYKGQLPPELRRLGLPISPAPSIPEEDRSPPSVQELENLIAAAVALDVLGTDLALLEEGSAVLHDLTASLLKVGALGGIDAGALQRLLHFAAGASGSGRATVSLRLAQALSGEAEIDPESEPNPPPPSSPTSVLQAIERIIRAAHLIVEHATLALQTQEEVRYWQA